MLFKVPNRYFRISVEQILLFLFCSISQIFHCKTRKSLSFVQQAYQNSKPIHQIGVMFVKKKNGTSFSWIEQRNLNNAKFDMQPTHVSAYLMHWGSDNMSSSSQMVHFPSDTIARLHRGIFTLTESEPEIDITLR